MPIVSISWFMRGMPSVRDVEHLGVAALEQGRAVRGRDQADLCGERPDVGRRAAVDADALLDDPLADELFGERPDRGVDLALVPVELAASRPTISSVGVVEGLLRSVLVVMALAVSRRSGADRDDAVHDSSE